MLPYVNLRDTEFKALMLTLRNIFHNKYIQLPDDLRLVMLCGSALKGDNVKNTIINKISLLLSGQRNNNIGKKTNRKTLIHYTENNTTHQIKFILAEKILHKDFERSGLDLLRGENFLAEIVDCIIIFLESLGTAAELGAFAVNHKLCNKLFVINDSQFINKPSFISNGPLKLVENTSNYSPVYYCDLHNISNSLPDIVNKIYNGPVKRNKRVHLPLKNGGRLMPKYWLLLLCDLIRIVQPVNAMSIEYIANQLIGKIKLGDLYTYLSIAIHTGLLKTEKYGAESLFFINPELKKSAYFSRVANSDVSEARLDMLNVITRHYPDYLDVWKAS